MEGWPKGPERGKMLKLRVWGVSRVVIMSSSLNLAVLLQARGVPAADYNRGARRVRYIYTGALDCSSHRAGIAGVDV